jgi:hypothetical protein
MRKSVLAAVATVLVAGASLAQSAGASSSSGKLIAGDPGGVVHARGQAGHHGGHGGGSPDLVWHSGQIMTSAAVKAVFWGPNWGASSFVSDKESGLDSLYNGAGGSAYIGTNTEYTGTNGTVSRSVSYGGHVVDLSATPSSAPSTTQVLAEVSRQISNPVANGYYPVYTDIPRGHAGYCAWHSYGSIGNVPVQFGFFFSLDNDPGCDPQDGSGLHSQGLAALANVSGHELSEAVTDPRNGGWWDSQGAENADKCAWTFNRRVVLSNGSSWKVQGNWSNAAYDHGQTGYTLGGCVDGN